MKKLLSYLLITALALCLVPSAMADASGKLVLYTSAGASEYELIVGLFNEKYPDIEFVGLVESGAESNTAAANLAATIQAHPDLVGVCAVDSEAGAGAIMAIREAGKIGEIKAISFDRGSEILQAVEEGIITATIVQQTHLMPYYSLQVLYNLNNCPVKQTQDDVAANMPGVPSYIDTGVTLCTQENVALFK